MSEKSERLRTGIAMLESISRQLEQASTEIGLQTARLNAVTDSVRQLAASLISAYDRARK